MKPITRDICTPWILVEGINGKWDEAVRWGKVKKLTTAGQQAVGLARHKTVPKPVFIKMDRSRSQEIKQDAPNRDQDKENPHQDPAPQYPCGDLIQNTRLGWLRRAGDWG